MKPVGKFTRVLLIVGIAVALYTVIGFFVAPPIARSQLEKRMSAELGRRVTVERIKLNPYALSVTLENFAIHEADGARVFLGWKRLYIDFNALASVRGEWVLQEIDLERLQGRLERNADLSLSVSDILTRLTPKESAPAKPDTPARPLRIAQLRVANSQFDFTDRSRSQPFTTVVGPVTFLLTDFHTGGARGAPHHFEAVTEAGEKIAWSGTIQTQPLRSVGKFSVEDFSLVKHAPYYADLLKGNLTGGTVSLQTRYEFTLAPGAAPNVILQEGGVRLRNLIVLERNRTEPVLELPALDVVGINADLAKRQASVDQVASAGMAVRARREADGAINLLSLFIPPAAAPASAPTRPPTPVAAPFDVLLKEFAVKSARIDILDNAAPQPTRLALGEMDVTVRNVSLKDGAVIPVEFAAAWAPQGKLRVAGNVTLSPLSAQLKTSLEGVDLRAVSPYLSTFAAARLTRGAVTAQIDLDARLPANAPVAATAAGDIRLENFELVDAARNEPLVGFGTLALSGLRVTTGDQLTLALQELALRAPYARIVVYSDKSLNLATVLQPPGGAPAQSKAAPGTTPATTSVAAPTSPAVASPSTPAPNISIARVVFEEGDYRFTDRSVEPAVTMTMNRFGGSIAGLASAGEGQADVKLQANVDGAGLVAITGRLDPLRAKKAMDLKVDFKNLDLVPLSPYSGKYAGFELARGKLLLDVKVTLDGPKIDAANVLTLNQFTFGAPVKSADATALPVRLGVALLKDRSGNIVIDLPIQGSTDDPEFKIGKVVMRVIVNLLTKAATSPFSLLGAAFGGGGEELAYQEFAPGKAEPLPTEAKKLKALSDALANRPALNVALEGAYDTAADSYALQRLKLADQVRRAIWQAKHATNPNVPPPEQLEISAEDHAAMIKRLYDEKFPPGTEFGAPLPPPPPTPAPPPPPPSWLKRAVATVTLQARRERREAEERSARARAEHAAAVQAVLSQVKPVDEMSGRLAEAIVIGPEDLRALSQARSQHVRDALIAGGTAADRLFLTKDQTEPTNPKQGARVFLTLQ